MLGCTLAGQTGFLNRDSGLSVYNYAHIGNCRSYVFADILRRYLKWKGYGLEHVMNITDVDDKTIKGSRKEGMALKEFTERYTKAFFEDIESLNIERVEHYPRATGSIGEIVKLVQALLDKGYAYKGNDAVYFQISKFKDYGKMAHLDMKGLKAGASVKQDEYDKEHVQDFALWKFWDKADGDVFWETSIGRGRPGWHVECSAMSMKYLGQSLDIHTGGVDLIFPHHQNEIAQSEAVTGRQFVKYWMHNEHLVIGGEKMSKSLGNFCTLRQLIGTDSKPEKTSRHLSDVLNKKYDPMTIRYLLLATHYRQMLNLTGAGLDYAKHTVDRIKEFTSRAKTGMDGKGMDALARKARQSFEKAMDDDLNMPLALSHVFDFMREANSIGAGKNAYKVMLDFDRILGLRLGEAEEWRSADQAQAEIRKLILEREEERKKKNWKEADRIRNRLKGIGIIVEDSKEGPKWRKE